MTTIKAASRHLLLAEIILGTLLCGVGAAKHAAEFHLSPYDLDPSYGFTWIVPAVIGSMQAAMAGVEWCRGRRWGFKQLQHNVCARGALAFVSVPLWLYELKEFAVNPTHLSGMVVLLVAPVCCAINAYSVYANRKVWNALDPRIPTSRMHFD